MFLCFLFCSLFAWPGVQSIDDAKTLTHTVGHKIAHLAQPKLHGNKKAYVGFLTLPPNAKVPMHQDKSEEYLFILEGKGQVWIDGKSYPVKANDLIFMPALSRVRFDNGDSILKLIQVFAGPESAQKYESSSWQ
jgi:mannose-6-phosphate isomerase-like protein (cupin superfamily)